MPAEPAVKQPTHPLPQMTTFELRDYRRDLETAISRLGGQDPPPPALHGLQIKLDAVIAEQESRTKPTADGRTR
jgi:hypothetical protein